MDAKTLPPPQEKSVSGKPDINASKQEILGLIQEFKIPANSIVQVGAMADQAISDKTLYPMLKETAIKSGMLDANDFGKGIDYKMLAVLSTLGRLAKDMISTGQLKG